MSVVDFDAGALEAIAKLFRREIWRTPPSDAIVECGIEVQGFGPLQATVFAELSEVPSVNVIMGVAEPGGVEGGHLADAIEWVGARNVDYRVSVAADRPETAAAEDWLSRNRYEQGDRWLKFVRGGASSDLPEIPGIEVLELEPDEGEGMSAIAAGGLGLPEWAGTLFFDLPGRERWHCYVALLGGELASCGAMMVDDGIAELGVDATHPAARGRGCQLALLRHRIDAASGFGCHTLFAEVGCIQKGTATTRGNLLHAGFEEAYGARSWRPPRSLGVS